MAWVRGSDHAYENHGHGEIALIRQRHPTRAAPSTILQSRPVAQYPGGTLPSHSPSAQRPTRAPGSHRTCRCPPAPAPHPYNPRRRRLSLSFPPLSRQLCGKTDATRQTPPPLRSPPSKTLTLPPPPMASPPPPPAGAAPAAAPGSSPSAQVVGNAFVNQYYNILHQSPEHVYRFYQEASRLGRPAGADGMDTVTTMDAINDKIVSMGIDRAEIKAVDAQESLCGGVTVLVMGHLTASSGVSREFVQSFFLAPQEKGYFVLNDILRYVGEGERGEGAEQPAVPPQQHPAPEVAADAEAAPAAILPNGTVGGDIESLPREQDAPPQPEQQVAEPAPHPQEEEDLNGVQVYNPPDDLEKPVVDETPVPKVINEVPNNVAVAAPSSSPPVPLEEAPKKSYASIVKVMKEYRPSAPVVPSRPAPPKPEKQAPPVPAPVADVPVSAPNPQSGSFQDPEVDAHAVYVRSLPLNATPQQLEEEFKRFGTIKHEGIQVRSNKVQGFCYGFVEFEDASAVQTAIEASPVMIGERQCYVEEKRTTGSRGSSRGRFAPGRGGNFRGEGIRGRGTYNGGRGYGRGEFNYRSDYGGRGGGRGGASRGGDASYQRVDHSGTAGGRGARVPSAATGVAK